MAHLTATKRKILHWLEHVASEERPLSCTQFRTVTARLSEDGALSPCTIRNYLLQMERDGLVARRRIAGSYRYWVPTP